MYVRKHCLFKQTQILMKRREIKIIKDCGSNGRKTNQRTKRENTMSVNGSKQLNNFNPFELRRPKRRERENHRKG